VNPLDHPLEDLIAHTIVADLMGDDTVIRDPVDSALDGEMAKHSGGKVIPPEEVAVDRYKGALEKADRARETECILEEAGIDDVVDEALRGLEIPDGADLLQDVSNHFKVAPQEWWATRINERGIGCIMPALSPSANFGTDTYEPSQPIIPGTVFG